MVTTSEEIVSWVVFCGFVVLLFSWLFSWTIWRLAHGVRCCALEKRPSSRRLIDGAKRQEKAFLQAFLLHCTVTSS